MLHRIFFFATLIAFALSCLAQDTSTGAIRGTVLDSSGGRIRGATVALVNDATGLHYEQTTDSSVANRVVAEISYSFVHGQNLIRARDVNLPQPTTVQYPISIPPARMYWATVHWTRFRPGSSLLL